MLRNCRMVVSRARCRVNAQGFGPIALDAAVSTVAARIKGMDDPVAGKADAILVPAIVVGNALSKNLVWFRSACAAGLVLGGRIPIVVPSRSDPPAARLASVALARIVHCGRGELTTALDSTPASSVPAAA